MPPAISGEHLSAILFDLDCTLIESRRIFYQSLSYALTQNGLPKPDEKRALCMLGLSMRDILQAVLSGDEKSPELIQRIQNTYYEYFSKNFFKYTTLLPGVYEVLRKLSGRGFRIALITSKPKNLASTILRRFNINKFFSAIVSGEDVMKPKPAPDIVIEAARRLKVEARDCVVVGDSPHDIKSGKAAGALTIAVVSGPYRKEILEAEKPHYIFGDVSEILRVL